MHIAPPKSLNRLPAAHVILAGLIQRWYSLSAAASCGPEMVKHATSDVSRWRVCGTWRCYIHVPSQMCWTLLRNAETSCWLSLATMTMNSFLFPEDLDGPPMQSIHRRVVASTRKPVPIPKNSPPQMPTRAPPSIPSQDITTPPPPAYAPPPVPDLKEKGLVSIVTCAAPDHKQEPQLQRTKSKRSYFQKANLAGFREKREAKALARAEHAAARVEVVLPPLSPVVDDEFWHTGRYPTSPSGNGLVHVAF